jgi:hypothetical protein
MRIQRMEMPCRCCDKPVGVFVNTEKYTSIADQYGPNFVPLCEDCGKMVREAFITPGRLRRIVTKYGQAAAMELVA